MDNNREKLNDVFMQLVEITKHENNLDVVDEVFVAARTIISAMRRLDDDAAKEEAMIRESEPMFLGSK